MQGRLSTTGVLEFEPGELVEHLDYNKDGLGAYVLPSIAVLMPALQQKEMLRCT